MWLVDVEPQDAGRKGGVHNPPVRIPLFSSNVGRYFGEAAEMIQPSFATGMNTPNPMLSPTSLGSASATRGLQRR